MIEKKSAAIGIIGLGYVGLPLSLSFVEADFKVFGLDTDRMKIQRLNNRHTYITHIQNERIKNAMDSGRFVPTCDFSRAAEADALIICVPTPLAENGEPNISFITDTMNSLLPHLKAGQLLSLESTTYPGTTEEALVVPVTERGFTIGTDFFVVYSPEREDPGNQSFNTRNIPKILGGHTPSCAKIGLSLYRQVINTVVEVSSTRTAEMVKLLENTFRLVNISLINELKILADRMGLDINEVIKGAATKPFGFTPFFPGPGIGGHCIPIDPFYLAWKAKTFGATSRFIELAGEINQAMPGWVVDKLERALGESGGKLAGATILALGATYKKDSDDIRESPALEVMKLLHERGARVSFSDPHVGALPGLSGTGDVLRSLPLTRENLERQDAAILLTDHSTFDYRFIQAHSRLIVDTRNVLLPGAGIVKA